MYTVVVAIQDNKNIKKDYLQKSFFRLKGGTVGTEAKYTPNHPFKNIVLTSKILKRKPFVSLPMTAYFVSCFISFTRNRMH